MKTFSTFITAGLLLASISFASQGDPYREERFKAKFGRYSTAEETRRMERNATSSKDCGAQECCSLKHAAKGRKADPQDRTVAAGQQDFQERWARAKFGRVIRREVNQSETVGADSLAARTNDKCGRPACCD